MAFLLHHGHLPAPPAPTIRHRSSSKVHACRPFGALGAFLPQRDRRSSYDLFSLERCFFHANVSLPSCFISNDDHHRPRLSSLNAEAMSASAQAPAAASASPPLNPIEKQEQPSASSSTHDEDVAAPSTAKGTKFWLIIISLLVATLLAALDLTAIATALPTISLSLASTDAASFVWIGASYSITSTASVPIFSGLANVFGRRSVLLLSLLFFLVGSALCGAAQNTSVIILGRSIQGVGSGGILSLTEIVLSDLVALSERYVVVCCSHDWKKTLFVLTCLFFPFLSIVFLRMHHTFS